MRLGLVLEAGYPLALEQAQLELWALGRYAGLQAPAASPSRVTIGGELAGSGRAHCLAGGLGARLSREVVRSGGLRLVPELRLGWVQAFSRAASGVHTFASGGGSTFSVDGSARPAGRMLAGLGLRASLAGGLELVVGYDEEWGGGESLSTVTAGLRATR